MAQQVRGSLFVYGQKIWTTTSIGRDNRESSRSISVFGKNAVKSDTQNPFSTEVNAISMPGTIMA